MTSLLKKFHNYIKRKGFRLKLNQPLFWFFYTFQVPDLTRTFKQKIRPGMIVLDVGAHIGYYSLVSSRLVGKRGKVYAFEPEQENYNYLKENLRLTPHKNITIEKKAISINNDDLKLYISFDNPSDHQTYSDKTGREAHKIKAVSIDEYLQKENYKADFIKMDIQGFEAQVLPGMKKTLMKNEDIIFLTEFWAYGIAQSGSDPKKYLSNLQDMGFKFYKVLNCRVEEKPSSIMQILALCKEGEKKNNYFHIDLLCNR